MTGALRSASRLAAVQALYQITLISPNADSAEVEDTIIDFVTHRPGAELPDEAFAKVDWDLFSDLVRGACRHQNQLVQMLNKKLPKRWQFERLDQILAEVLISANYELLYRTDVPVAVIINEYVEITKAFYGGKESGFINGVLQEISQELRFEEMLEHTNERANAC